MTDAGGVTVRPSEGKEELGGDADFELNQLKIDMFKNP
jgi:hypothetical protein